MARVWNNVTNLENLSNRTILQLLQNQNELLQEFAKQIEQIEGIANTAVGTANNAAAVASQAVAGAEAAKETAREAVTTATQAGVQAAQAVNVASNAVGTAADALDKVNEYEPQVDGAVTAANEAKTAANSAVTTAGAANQSANQALTQVANLSDDVETNTTDIAAIEAREAGYGKSLSISGNTLSLMHDATNLSTVALPGGGASVPAVVELTDWSTVGTGGASRAGISSLGGCYGINITGKTWLIWGDTLSDAITESNATTMRLVPPSSLGSPSFAAGFACYTTTTVFNRMLQITTEASGGSGINITEGLAGAGATWRSLATSRVESFWAVITFV